MDSEQITSIVVAALPVAAALLQAIRTRGGGRQHRQVKLDLELYSLVPDASASKKVLLAHIDSSIDVMIKNARRRDPTGISVAAIFLVAAIALFVWFRDQWWSWPAIVFLTLFGVVGLSLDAVPRERDEKGRALRRS